MKTKRYVLTGAPSSGKSTILRLLSHKNRFDNGNYFLIEEAAEYIINRELRKEELGNYTSEILPWKNTLKFQKVVYEQISEWEENIPEGKIVFQDRGIFDGIAYLDANGIKTYKNFLKNQKRDYALIFMLDRLPNFKNTEIRQDEHLAEFLDVRIEQVYKDLGYEVVRVPVLPKEERLEYIMNVIQSREEPYQIKVTA